MPLRILIGCEFSATVRDAFIRHSEANDLGHQITSCDLLPSESSLGPHLQQNILYLLTPDRWDMLIAFPPCTYLARSGIHLNRRFPSREQRTRDAAHFFLQLWNAPVPRIAIENPPGAIRHMTGVPVHQTIHPWQYGDPVAKTVCLRLKNLLPLRHGRYVPPPYDSLNDAPATRARARERERFFPGIADAMAEQWGRL
jgi:hypothetical protein